MVHQPPGLPRRTHASSGRTPWRTAWILIETACFRVAQEALTNVVRHAKARPWPSTLRKQNGHLHLSVRDDGVGFNVAALREEAVHGASLGLLSMEERATLADGGLESSPPRPGHRSPRLVSVKVAHPNSLI